jgi:DNA-binding NtrC family response regulator
MTLHTPQPHILLVEDEAHVYQTLLRRLQAENYQVTLATTYAQARELLAVQHFHLAIFDMNLDSADEADRSGYQLLKEIAALDLPSCHRDPYGTMSMAIDRETPGRGGLHRQEAGLY